MKIFNLQYIIAFIVLSFLFQSCFKEDEKGPPYFPSNLEQDTINVGPNYENQVYFDLYSLKQTSMNSNLDWDIAFVTGEDSWNVILNSSLMMWAGNAYDTNFSDINSAEGLEMHFDVSSGNMDSTAIGEWYYAENDLLYSHHYVYVIDRGIDSQGNPLGFKKISLGLKDQKYTIRYANLDGSEEQNLVVEKDILYNYTHLSFENGLVKIEPPKDQWSLKFSRYSTILFTDEGEAYPYNVVGVLINPYLVETNFNTDDFFDLTYDHINDYEYIKLADVIGYAWKDYDFDGGYYTVLPNRTYIINNNDGFYYRLRFQSFYGLQGNKGNIGIEFSRL